VSGCGFSAIFFRQRDARTTLDLPRFDHKFFATYFCSRNKYGLGFQIPFESVFNRVSFAGATTLETK
jgi:hypothetical protein